MPSTLPPNEDGKISLLVLGSLGKSRVLKVVHQALPELGVRGGVKMTLLGFKAFS